MTSNQVAWLKENEVSRSNRAQEALKGKELSETVRSNLRREAISEEDIAERRRHNVVGEIETNRHNLTGELETGVGMGIDLITNLIRGIAKTRR